jgi:hypothetical protein
METPMHNESLDKVRVKKSEVLVALRKNLTKHKEEYNVAAEQYRARAKEELTEKLKTIIDGKNISLHTNLSPPDNHTKEYERTIKMLEMCQDESVYITSHQFDCFIEDEWGWKESFMLKNSTYMARR